MAGTLGELIWMAKSLRFGRMSIAFQPASSEMPDLPGGTMSQRGEQLLYTGKTRGPQVDLVLGGMVQERHACPHCGIRGCPSC